MFLNRSKKEKKTNNKGREQRNRQRVNALELINSTTRMCKAGASPHTELEELYIKFGLFADIKYSVLSAKGGKFIVKDVSRHFNKEKGRYEDTARESQKTI